jgi:hypothetical protein
MPSLGIIAASWLAISFAGTSFGQKFRPNQYIVEYASNTGALAARDSLASKGGIQVRKTFSSGVFSGASIETEAFDLDSLIALPEVANVWRNNIYTLEPSSAQVNPAKPLDSIIHNTTGVSKLHDAGILGEGAVVGIVDTGIWYDHPAVSVSQSSLSLS